MKIQITPSVMPDQYWLVYRDQFGNTKHLYLSGCANTFAAATGIRPEGALRCVGWRYEEDGQLCYELFNAGHLTLCTPLNPGALKQLLWRLQGKDPEAEQKKTLEAFEKALNAGGWMTLPRPDKAE